MQTLIEILAPRALGLVLVATALRRRLGGTLWAEFSLAHAFGLFNTPNTIAVAPFGAMSLRTLLTRWSAVSSAYDRLGIHILNCFNLDFILFCLLFVYPWNGLALIVRFTVWLLGNMMVNFACLCQQKPNGS